MPFVRSIAAAALLFSGGVVAADYPDPQPPARFNVDDVSLGYAGMSLAADDNTVVLGDPYHDGQSTSGAVLIYRRGPAGWSQEAVLQSPPSRYFGRHVTLENDRLLVGFATGSGVELPKMNLYERVALPGGAEWRLVASRVVDRPTTGFCRWKDGTITMSGDEILLVPTDSRCQSRMFQIVSGPQPAIVDVGDVPFGIAFNEAPASNISFHGDTVVVGRPSGSGPGAVEVFRRSAGQWVSEALLPGRTDADRLGFGVSVSLDGDTLAVGGNWEPAQAVGYARVYRRTAAGQWLLEAEFEHPTERDPARNPSYGFGVAIKGDRLAVSAFKDDFAGVDAGTVFLYGRSGGEWRSLASFSPTHDAGAWAGFTLRMTSNRVAVGALGLDGVGGGFAFDDCSISGGPGPSEPRCLPGGLGLLTFIQAFFANDPFADFDRSGSVSVQDLFDYLAAWFAGCP